MTSSDALDRIGAIQQRFRRRSNYAVHTVFYLCSVLLFVLFLRNPAAARAFMTLPNTGDLLLLLLIWTVIFVAHSVRFYFQEQMDRAIRHELAGPGTKPKRHPLRLADDGEVVEEADHLEDEGLNHRHLEGP